MAFGLTRLVLWRTFGGGCGRSKVSCLCACALFGGSPARNAIYHRCAIYFSHRDRPLVLEAGGRLRLVLRLRVLVCEC